VALSTYVVSGFSRTGVIAARERKSLRKTDLIHTSSALLDQRGSKKAVNGFAPDLRSRAARCQT